MLPYTHVGFRLAHRPVFQLISDICVVLGEADRKHELTATSQPINEIKTTTLNSK